MLTYNPITDTDSYKFSHFRQYPPGTEFVNSYIESRGGQYEDVVFFGLQAYLKEYLSRPLTKVDINEAEEMVAAHGLPFNRPGFDRILDVHGGFWPVKVDALKEGTVVKPHNCLVQVVNTDRQLPWVTSFLETPLLRAVWYPTTVASRSRKIKKIIKGYLDATADSSDGLPFKLHDFGARGVSSRESSCIGGLAHLVNFMGTDTFDALRAARRYYSEPMAGFSIPASEHSTITAWTKAKESDAYRNMIQQFGGEGKLIAVVSDSYDIFNACEHIWPTLKAAIIQSGSTVVIRPDSGIPHKVVLQVLRILASKFGYTVNSKGYMMLPPHIRVIQGDGINEDSVELILKTITEAGFSADNVAFGMGGELLQTPNRDTNKFAMKASAIYINGEWVGVAKEPVGDASKKSKEGILKVVSENSDPLDNSNLITVRNDSDNWGWNRLECVYLNGEVMRDQTLSDIRALAA